MFALNFYTDLYGDALKRGRKSATIRLGDKSAKYATGQIVWVTVGQRFARRKKLFCAILDAVEVKVAKDLSPRDIQRENPEFHTTEDAVTLLSRIYAREVSEDEIVTVIYFSPIDEYEL
ncbi:MAG: ASCH domain-containing protein [Capsulimonas sp.]|uniref:ASCH domain-containing protein n=1 Tax=Capsulimonas sp. TaxID=2494211 RepID=UPI0032653935